MYEILPSIPFRCFCPCVLKPAGRACRRLLGRSRSHGCRRTRGCRACGVRDDGGGDGDEEHALGRESAA